MKIITLLVFIIQMYSLACNSNEKPVANDRDTPKKTLIAVDSSIIANETEAFYPFRIYNVNDIYLLINQRTKNNFIKIIDIESLKTLYNWGKEGRGPAEFLIPPITINTAANENVIYLGDLLDYEVDQYVVSDTTLAFVKSNSLRYEGQRNLPERARLINNGIYYIDNEPITPEDNYEYLIVETDNAQVLKKFGSYPLTDIDYQKKPLVFRKSNLKNPITNEFVSMYMFFNAFKIYDANAQLKKEILVNDFKYEEIDLNEYSDYLFRLGVTSSQEFIYSLGIYGNGKDVYQKLLSDKATIFEAWNWDGELKYSYSFDRVIHYYTVSEKLGLIYGITLNEPNKIILYPLPHSSDSK
jgi:hypothetical protein